MCFWETDRLLLRKFSSEDWKDLYDYLSCKTVVKYEPYDVFSEEASKQEAVRRSGDDAFWANMMRVASSFGMTPTSMRFWLVNGSIKHVG